MTATVIDRIKERAEGAITIPDEVWDCEQLKPVDIKLYRILLHYGFLICNSSKGILTKNNEPVIDVSQRTLAVRLGATVTTTASSLNRLEDVALIRIIRSDRFKENNRIIITADFFSPIEQKKEEEQSVDTIIRIPIILKNKPKTDSIEVAANENNDLAERSRQKLIELGRLPLNYTERKVMNVVRHYEFLAREFTNRGGYFAVSRKGDPKEHKNWKYFDKLYTMCKEKGWNPELYLDCQFDRAKKHWKNSKIKFPLPKMLCSENGQNYFERWLKDMEEISSYNIKGNKVKAKRAKSKQTEIINEIAKTVTTMGYYTTGETELDRKMSKVIRIEENWMAMPPSYLWSVPWFKEYFAALDADTIEARDAKLFEKYEKIRGQFSLYNSSKRLQKVIMKTVEMFENEFKIPANMTFEEMNELQE